MSKGDEMAKLSHDGHRERIRNNYLSGGMENAPDYHLLELFLSIIIPRREVKTIAYDLLNTFDSLEGVINADPEDLMAIDGIGEKSAIGISLIKDIYKRIEINKNSNLKTITSSKEAIEYCRNRLIKEQVETLILVTLSNDGSIIKCHKINSGSANVTSVDVREILAAVIRDKAVSVILSHNHPNGTSEPSAQDINFTLEVRNTLSKINVSLTDHIIVGKDSCETLRDNPRYLLCL